MDLYEYLQQQYDNKKTDWNPKEHGNWELPPIKLVEQYLREYPV